jgi:hypothetical protein
VRLGGGKKERQLPAGSIPPHQSPARPADQQKNRLVKRLADLGYAVEIKPLAA